MPTNLVNQSYFEFIEQCRSKDYSNFKCQKHHIIPKSQGGLDDESNLIILNTHDHFWAHVLYAYETNTCLTASHFILHTYKCKEDFTEEEFEEATKITYSLMSFAHKGKYVPPEVGRKISAANLGKHHTKKRKPYSKEFKDHLSKLYLGRTFYTNGIQQVWGTEDNHPDGFWKGTSQNTCKGKKVFTNGIKTIRAFECPEGFRPGRHYKANGPHGLKWFNNGVKAVQTLECPEGFHPGRKLNSLHQ
jgi:hypothetical protein